MADVIKNTEDHRFEVHVEGELAGWLDYIVGSRGVITLPHTVVEERFRGRGLAGDLVRAGLDDIRSQGYLVRPKCSYVQGWIAQHPEYDDLVAR